MSTQQIIVNFPAISQPTGDLQEVFCGDQFQEFLDFKRRKPGESKGLDSQGVSNLRNSTIHILKHCNPHNATENNQTTHLVVGYVQSGKTMSFTALIKLAVDNKYKVVIVFTGATNILLGQTASRLKDDLICNNTKNYKKIKFQVNPSYNDKEDDRPNIIKNLRAKGRLIVIPILKHYAEINTIASIFSDPDVKNALGKETLLIIDDEADQASLNTNGSVNTDNDAEGKLRSSTYEAIVNLRNSLPGNSYVQYTATPQANILIDAMDVLSPKSHTLLKPGNGYDGGKLFFGKDKNDYRFGDKLIEIIPEGDLVYDDPANTAPPQSMCDAVMQHIFSTYLMVEHFDRMPYLSMMIHADVTELWNAIIKKWVELKLKEWNDILSVSDTKSRKYQWLMMKLLQAYQEVIKFFDANDVPPFTEAVKHFQDIIGDTRVYLVIGVSKESHNITWEENECNILVGANMLNRGFTINNLATTYMPRFPKTPNADTIEQRCRFFGYKEDYIRCCRVFLPLRSKEAYEKYVESEEELRYVLSTTKSILDFGQSIMLDPRLKPTRRNVLPSKVVTDRLKESHEFQSFRTNSEILSNKSLVERFITSHSGEWKYFKSPLYNPDKYEIGRGNKHECIVVSASEAIAFLTEYISSSYKDISYQSSTKRFIFYLSQIKETPVDKVMFVNIGLGFLKERTLGQDYKVTSRLLTGPTANGSYPGDKAIKSNDIVTIQLHHLWLENISKEAYGLQIFYPESLSTLYCTTQK